jgi:two-component system phosphate regulon response regulator PhoB
MAKKQILVIDDEEDIQELISYNLTREEFDVTTAISGEDGLATIGSHRPDLIILDIMLPGMNGLEVCRTLKSNPTLQDIPIIMLSARGEEADIVAGLELGADDYVPKPFSPRILLARVRAVLRRPAPEESSPPSQESVVTYHQLVINPKRHEVTLEENPIDLTATEFRILKLLVSSPGWVFTRNQIIKDVHGDDYPVTDRSVDVQITGLRKKLQHYGEFLETVRGVGYRFKEQND